MTRLMLALLIMTAPVLGGELHLITSTHEHVVVDVLSQEQIGGIKALIADCMGLPDTNMMMIHNGKMLVDQESVKPYVGEEVFVAKAASNFMPNFRDYYAPLASNEKETIRYILTTLANKSLFSLPKCRSSLQAAGNKVEHLHPLKFLLYAYSDEELKVCMGVIQGRSFVWREFISNFADSLQKEVVRGNITSEHLHHFAETVHVKVDIIAPHANSSDWVKFVKTLNAYVPRANTQNRYNM